LLTVDRITKRFDGKLALDQVSLEVPPGKTHALIGSSGSGKSTLLRILLGVVAPDEGSVSLGASRIGYVPQEGGLFPHLTARENVALVAGLKKWPTERIEKRLEVLWRSLELDPALMDRYPAEISGGQKQRVALARATFLDPELLLLDEPLGALDPLIRHGLQVELRGLFRKLGKTVLLVTHDLGEAAFFADGLTLLHEGRVVQTGHLRDFLDRPADPFVSRFVSAQRTLENEGGVA
jgi:osmoprotectant transport system ATP-binding protein